MVYELNPILYEILSWEVGSEDQAAGILQRIPQLSLQPNESGEQQTGLEAS